MIKMSGVTCDVQFDRCWNRDGHVVICGLAREDGVEVWPLDVGDDKLIGDFVLGWGGEGVVHQMMVSPPGDAGPGPPP